jgi:hypothetical protein
MLFRLMRANQLDVAHAVHAGEMVVQVLARI